MPQDKAGSGRREPSLLEVSRNDGTPPNPSYIVPGLHRGLTVLTLFRRDRQRLSLTEIAKLLGLARSAAFRLVYTLESLGFLKRNPEDDRYELGARVLSLGYALLSSMDVVDRAERPLRRLRDATGGSAHMGRLDGTDVVYIMRFAAPDSLAGNVQVGARLPAHATTLGRALLMDSDPETLVGIFGDVESLPAFTHSTARTLPDLARQLAEDRARGYVVGHSIYENGLDSMAAPIRDRDGRIVVAISIVGFGLVGREREKVDALVAELLATAREISDAISG